MVKLSPSKVVEILYSKTRSAVTLTLTMAVLVRVRERERESGHSRAVSATTTWGRVQ